VTLLPVGDLVGDRFQADSYLPLLTMPGARVIAGEGVVAGGGAAESALRHVNG